MKSISRQQYPFRSSRGIESNYRKTVLPNGIRVVTEAVPYVRSVSVGVWLDVGSRDEDSANNGISHFVEHMVFKGTKHFRGVQIARSLEALGGYLNAFTSKESTCYYARILDEHVAKAFDVLADLVQYPLFDTGELEKEKQVVIEEIKHIEDDPDDLIHDYFDRSIFSNHPLGLPVIGTSQTVAEFSRTELFTHMRRYYVPRRIVVSAAGNLSHESVVKLVAERFRSRVARTDRLSKPPKPKSQRTGKEVFEKRITQAHVCLGTLGFSAKHPLRYPLLVLNSLLGEGMSSRLFQNIREKYGFAYNVYSFANFLSDVGNFGVYIGTDRNNVDNSIELIHKELLKLRRTPVSDSELKRTKSQLKGTLVLSLEDMSSRMMRMGSGELLHGDITPVSEIIRRIDAVSVEELSQTADHLFRPERFSTVIIEPAEQRAAA